jgi:excinuclease ABC subunit C
LQIALKKFSPEKIPTSPGLYFFIGPNRKVLYIGKAANLRERVRSYFRAHVSEKVERLRQEATTLRIIPLASEIEALIQEAEFIKRNRPKYNVLLRDDKNYFFVAITKETFPRIFVTHQPKQLRDSKVKMRNFDVLGPYVSGRALKSTLRLIRRVFPYCTCPAPHRRTCLKTQLGLCPGYCCNAAADPSAEEIRRYRRTIAHIKKILIGENRSLQRELERNLRNAVRQKRFEDAARIRDELEGLSRMLAHRGLLLPFETKEIAAPSPALEELQRILRLTVFPRRIECYDASVIAGTHAVGAMTVFVYGTAAPSTWRLFRMRRPGTPTDPAQIEEMLTRRLAHREWPLPDLIIVDGGIAQRAAAERALRHAHLAIPIIAIAKGNARRDRLVWGTPPRMRSFAQLPPELAHLLRRIRDATHQFSLAYHRHVRRKSVFA